MAPRPRYQPDQRLLLLSGRPPGDGEERWRQDDQYRFDDVAVRRAFRGGVAFRQRRYHPNARAMATAWAKDNIQVNAVLPGWIDTDLTKRAREQVTGLHDSVEKRTPHGRWGTPDDMAGIAAFLASP